MSGMKRTLEKALSGGCTSEDVKTFLAYANIEISEWREFVEYCQRILVDMEKDKQRVRGMKEIRINIFEQIGSNAAVSSEDGEALYRRIMKGLAEKDVIIILDFTNIELITLTFLNTAIGQLYGRYDSTLLRERLKVSNLAKEDLGLLKKVVERAKEYFGGNQWNGIK